jgi:hypothetical protein
MNIITGPNDVGKSNLLRALNLFFNELNHDREEIDFSEEFSHKRLEVVRKESVKGKQFIQIAVEFNRGDFFLNTLPERFKVIKTWHRDSPTPAVTDDIQSYINSGKLETTIVKARGSLQRFLNRISYTYIPAIKDKETFSGILGDLQDSMFEASQSAGSSLTSQITSFNTELKNQTEGLRDDFASSTGIEASISLPLSMGDLFQSFNVKTDGLGGEFVSLDQRGDGIRVRFIPAIMNYIAQNSTKQHVWGFEEPENSMEFKRAFELNAKMRNVYSKNAQIFLTTHSPAFIDLKESDQSIYWTVRENDETKFHEVNEKSASDLFSGNIEIGLAEELGHIALLSNLHNRLSTAIVEANAVKAAGEMLKSEFAISNRPLLLTEGRTDPALITEAWKRLRKIPTPFSVKSCNTMPADEPSEAAGATVLAGALKTVRADSPYLTIGLFDRDPEGMKEFALDKNFSVVKELQDAKIHKNNKSAAILLPFPESLQHFAMADNLPIEFLFNLSSLQKTFGGHGLRIMQREYHLVINNKKESTYLSDKPEHMYIDGGKVWFADKVVPTLEDADFGNFEPLLSLIEKLIADYELSASVKPLAIPATTEERLI